MQGKWRFLAAQLQLLQLQRHPELRRCAAAAAIAIAIAAAAAANWMRGWAGPQLSTARRVRQSQNFAIMAIGVRAYERTTCWQSDHCWPSSASWQARLASRPKVTPARAHQPHGRAHWSLQLRS